MEVKPGYKKTEVGFIPEEWEAMRVCDFASVVTGGTPRTEIRGFWNGCYPWVTPTDITDQRDMWASERMITEAGLDSIRQLPANSVLVTSIASIGKNAILRSVGGCNQQINAVVPKEVHSPEFLYYSFESSKQYLLANAGMTATRIISKAAFEQLKFPIPPPPEQRAIATALSDVDALLGSLDRLIAKKRDLKQAAMQQLLTGQTRLPGFHGEWEQVNLGSLFKFKNGLNKGKEFFGYGTPIVNYMDVFGCSTIRAAQLNGRVSLTPEEIQNFDVKKGDVFFTRTSETAEEIGIASVMLDEPNETVFSGFVLRGRPINDRLSDDFKAYCFKSVFVRKQIVSKASYTTRALTNGRFLSAVILPVPALPEQTAIAEVLMDMEAELAALEQRREKTRALKQAMMQELLTGKTRLVAREASHA
jgi:type I restriction enzyme, S subunit